MTLVHFLLLFYCWDSNNTQLVFLNGTLQFTWSFFRPQRGQQDPCPSGAFPEDTWLLLSYDSLPPHVWHSAEQTSSTASGTAEEAWHSHLTFHPSPPAMGDVTGQEGLSWPRVLSTMREGTWVNEDIALTLFSVSCFSSLLDLLHWTPQLFSHPWVIP